MARRASVLAVVIALVVAGPARAESLAGETTIASARPGVVSVRLDKTLHFDEGSLPSARFAGNGEWRAVALIGLTETAYVPRTRRGWRVWWSDRRQLVAGSR